MINEEKIYNQFESGEITITLDEETAQKAREIFGVENSRAEYEFIKNALEKQIPKKPSNVYKTIGNKTIITGMKCPNENCDNISLGNNEYLFPYCEECGQALDWRNYNEENYGKNHIN